MSGLSIWHTVYSRGLYLMPVRYPGISPVYQISVPLHLAPKYPVYRYLSTGPRQHTYLSCQVVPQASESFN